MLASSPLRLLLVDDDPAFLGMLEAHLERVAEADVELSTTTDPEDALAAVDADAVDCVVSDYEMPERSGLELLAAVRERDARLPFVLLTGAGNERVASDAVDAAVTSYLRKHAADSTADLAERVLDVARDAVRDYQRDAALEEHVSFVESVLGALDDVIYVITPDGTPLYWSDALREITGYGDADLSALTVTDIVPPDHHDALATAMNTVLDGESVTVQLPIRPREGDPVPFELSGAPLYGDDGSVVGIAGIGRDLSEREHYETALEGLQRATTRLFEADTPAAVGAVVADVVDYVSPAVNGVVYRHDEREGALVPSVPDAVPFRYDVDEDAPVARVYRSGDPERHDVAAIDDGRDRPDDAEAALYVPLDGHGVLVFSFAEVDPAGRPWALAEILAANVTAALDRIERTAELRERERALATLHARSGDFARSTDPDDVARIVADAARDVLEVPRVAVYRWDDDAGHLHPVAGDTGVASVDASSGARLVWEAFVERRTVVADDRSSDGSADAERAPWPDADSAMARPLDDYGVLVAAVPPPAAFDDRDVALADLLAADATSALERAAREARLRETESELRERNRDLQRLNRLSRVIRDITGALVQAQSRGSVVRAVCERLAADERYPLAWVGTLEDGLDVEAWAGAGEGFLDYLLDGDAHALARDALESGDPVVVDDVLRDPAVADLRREAMDRGFRSAVCLPLCYHGTAYGFLELYASVPGAFTGEERDVLVELAAHIANALAAVERTETLLSGRSLELQYDLGDVDDPLFGLARRAGRTLDVDAVAPHDDAWLVYATVEAGADDVLDVAERSVAVTDADVVRSASDGTLLALVVTNAPVVEAVADRGATIRHVRAAPDGGSVTVAVRPSTDVRAFTEAVRERLPSADLARRAVTPDASASAGVRDDLEDLLTERQLQALRAAYVNGYFEWPRRHTGEDVAAELGVSGPTFHQHLRKALATVLADALDAPG